MIIIIWIHGVSLQALAVSSSSRQQMHLLVILPTHTGELAQNCIVIPPHIGQCYTVTLTTQWRV